MTVELSNTIQDRLTISQTDLNAGYEFRTYDHGAGTLSYITSDSVNRHLRIDDVAVVEGEPYEIPERFVRYSQIMLEHQLGEVHKEAYANHRVVGISSDLAKDSESVRICLAEYYDMLATFYSFPYAYRNDKTKAIEFNGASFIYNDFGVVYPMSTNFGINPIGANTIAVTKDDQLLIQRQAEDARTNPGRLMPSGSGVASWHDYAYDDGTFATTLQQIVVHGAEYKLVNECALPADCPMTTRVMGMARVPTGLKPDFYCITTLGMTADELRTAGATPYEFLDAREGLSASLMRYIAERNGEVPSSVALQLYLEARLLAEICR